MKDRTVCFALLAYNCKYNLEKNLLRIEHIKNKFKESIIIVVENNSTDGTKELLSDLKNKTKNFFVLTKDVENSLIDRKSGGMERIIKMASFRNQYLNFIFQSTWRTKFDYLIVIDADIDAFSEEGLIKTIENAPSDWSALFANGRYYYNFLGVNFLGQYYDLFAFIPCQEYSQPDDRYELTYREMAIFSDLLTNKKLKNYQYFECRSAFGGIGIYKIESIQNSQYKTHQNDRSSVFEAVCEHIAFNISCLEYGKNYISSEMLVYYEKRFNSVLSKFIPAKIRVGIYEIIKQRKIKE
jgi:glycosyltransferase involved in cell wall biosynthesis